MATAESVLIERQIKLLEDLASVSLRGLEDIRLDKVLYNAAGKALREDFFTAAKDIIKRSIRNGYTLKADLKNSDLLMFTYDYKRPDHQRAWQAMKDLFTGYDELFLREEGIRTGRQLSVGEMFRSAVWTAKCYRTIRKLGRATEMLVLSVRLAELKRLRDELKGYSLKNKVAVMFFDGNSYENLVAQYLKSCGVTCVTMQHGQPYFHGRDADLINQTIMFNFSSDYIIVTGEYSKQQFLLAGVREEAIRALGTLREISPWQETASKKFAVFLDSPLVLQGQENNRRLLLFAEEAAKRLGYRYTVKLHPRDSRESYRDWHSASGDIPPGPITISEALDGAEFALLHISGVYLDILAQGKKAFCFLNGEKYRLVTDALDMFSSEGEFAERLEQWRQMDKEQKRAHIEKQIDHYMYPAGAPGRHVEFINTLIAERSQKSGGKGYTS